MSDRSISFKKSSVPGSIAIMRGDNNIGHITKVMKHHDGERWCEKPASVGQRISRYDVWFYPGIRRSFEVPLWSDPRLTLSSAKLFVRGRL